MAPPVEVVFVHGFMGSRGRVRDSEIWPNFAALRDGGIALLDLQHDDVAFSRLHLERSASSWAEAPSLHVHRFFYDWRQDIDRMARALGDFIDSRLKGGPAHLVARGMGGLVCRSLFRQRPELWDELAAKGLDRGGRLLLIGTPNEGCYEAAAILSGDHPLPRWIDVLDLKHNAEQVAGVFRSFPSLYQMLPTPARCAALHDAATWKQAGIKVDLANLARAREFHDSLARAALLDPARVACIVGASTRTRVGFGGVGRSGLFGFELGLDGDGLVPAAMAVLPETPVYEVHGGHGAFLQGSGVDDAGEVHKGIVEVLTTGHTTHLFPAVTRIPSPFHEHVVRRQIIEGRLFQIARGVDADDDVGDAERDSFRARCAIAVEQALIRAAFGDEAGAERAIDDALTAHLRVSRGPVLRVKLLGDDIIHVKTPLLVIAYCAGAAPSGSEETVDKRLDSWISRAIVQRIVSASLGETFVVPTGGKIAAESVLLVGKGPAGRLSLDDLRYMAINVAFTAASLKKRKIATVALGTGRGELTREAAIRAMIEGLREGLLRWIKVSGEPSAGAEVDSFQVTIIERRKEVYDEAQAILEELAGEKDPQVILEKSGRRAWLASTEGEEGLPDIEDATRITIEESASGESITYRFSALGRNASVPLHEISVQPRFLEELTKHLYDPRAGNHEQLGKLFCSYLIPDALREVLNNGGGVTLVLDHEAAALPWEMACMDGASKTLRLGTDVKLSRQLRTRLVAAPAVAPAASNQLNVLVIADPASGPKLALPEARREGEEVFELFEAWRCEHKANCHVVKCIGPDESDPLTILELLLQGDFDILHFTGHGAFDAAHPARSGWVLGDNLVLTAREMFRARRVPRLVFSNACWSSTISAKSPRHSGRDLVGMAEAFMSMGVENYIGASRPVDAHVSAALALDFYRQALDAQPLAEALRHARNAVYKPGDGTWGAFQLYGVGSALLIPTLTRDEERVRPSKSGGARRHRRAERNAGKSRHD